MRITYLGNDRPYSTERYVKHTLVKDYDCDVRLLNVGTTDHNSLILHLASYKPDVLLFSKPSRPFYNSILDWCKKVGLPTVCWQWDLYWGYRNKKPVQFKADLLFTTDGGHCEEWQRNYPHHQVLRQGIHEPEAKRFSTDYVWDVAFVGTLHCVHQGRIKLVRHLKSKYGNRFKHVTSTRGIDLNKLLARVKIVVGDSYPSPNYWSNRIYEILGRGGFLLYPETEGLDEEFSANVHYAPFTRGDFKGLDERIEFYLHKADQREHIRRLGFELVAGQYTYRHRVGQLLSRIASIVPPPQSGREVPVPLPAPPDSGG